MSSLTRDASGVTASPAGRGETTRRLRSFGPELLIVAAGLLFAILSRGRHANVTEDHGFWFSAAQSLVSGGRPLHEVRLQWGPGSLWILAAVGRIFGMRATRFVVFQFVVGLAAIVGVQIFARRFLSPIERWLSAAILVVLIVWMRGPGNLLYPCAFAMSHALFLLIAALLLHGFAMERRRIPGAIASGMLAGAALLTKQEFGAAAALGIAALTLLATNRAWSARLRMALASGGAFLATYFGALFAITDGEEFRILVRSNQLWPWVPVPAPWAALYRRLLGLDDPGARFVEAANSLIHIAAIGGTIWLALYLVDLDRRRRVLALSGVAIAWVLWLWRWSEGSHFLPMTLTLPAILGSAVVIFVLPRSRPPLPAGEAGPPQGDRVRELPHPHPLPPGEGEKTGAFFAVAAGALVLLQRAGYRGGIEGYYSGMGYVLAVPVIAVIVAWLVRGRSPATFRARIAAPILLFIVLGFFGLGRLRALERDWKDAVPFETARGRLYAPSGVAPAILGTADFIRRNTKPKDPILILPSTYALDFMLDRVDLSFFPYVSPGYLSSEMEQELVERCRRTPPKAVVVFEHTLGLLRSGDFDQGFATSLMTWVRTNLPVVEPFSFPGGRRGVRFRAR